VVIGRDGRGIVIAVFLGPALSGYPDFLYGPIYNGDIVVL